MDEIVKVQNEIVETPADSVEPFRPEKELLVVDDLPHVPFKQLVNFVLQRVSLGEVISKIKSETEYVVQVPLKFKEAFEKGEVFIAQNKDTLQLRPQLAKYNDKGKYEFVGPMDMIERNTVTGNPLQGIADKYQNIAMQQQMAQLSELMEKTHETVRRIEQGQYDDRIGHLIAGKNMICLALSDPEHIDEAELNSGREQLQIGCAQIGQTVYRRATEFKKIPKSRIVRDLQLFIHSDYYDAIDDDYGKIEECFDFYLQGTKMLAASYAICGETEKASLVFEQAKQTISQIDFEKVKNMAYIHPKEVEWLFELAPQYIDASKASCLDEAKKYDMLSVKVSGQELLEAYANGGTEGIQEERT